MSGCHCPNVNCKCQGLSEKVEKLSEDDKKGHYLLKGQLDAVFERIENLEDVIKDIHAIQDGRKPYKCPVCNGQSKIQVFHRIMEAFEKRIVDSQGRHFILCHTCEGKGIVWG